VNRPGESRWSSNSEMLRSLAGRGQSVDMKTTGLEPITRPAGRSSPSPKDYHAGGPSVLRVLEHGSGGMVDHMGAFMDESLLAIPS